MTCIYPHQLFQADFLNMWEEAQRPEQLDPLRKEESSLGKEIFFFFGEEVLPLILSHDWIYEGARTFVTEYAEQYFSVLRLLRSVEDTQLRLVELKAKVKDLLAAAISLHLAPASTQLVKPSDFVEIIQIDKLPTALRQKAKQLYEEAIDLEDLYVQVVSQALHGLYEKGLPRIFFVVKRALKVRMNAKPTAADNSLGEPHQYLNWCKQHLGPEHVISRVFVEHSHIYRAARNVASHQLQPEWRPASNEVFLPDTNNPQLLSLTAFSQLYRFLMYFCEMGTRGILAVFADRERGEKSNRAKHSYMKMYDNPELEAQLCDYPE